MTHEDVNAIFLLAGIELYAATPTPNLYGSASYRGPWWWCQTVIGPIQIGWRKRVILIDWSLDNPLRCEVTRHDVTKSETMVHAWSYSAAVEYLAALRTYARSDAGRRSLEEAGA